MSDIQPPPGEQPDPNDRRSGQDRRQGDRRKKNIPVAFERRSGKDRRQNERRRQVDPTTCEKEYSAAEVEFMKVMELYKRLNHRPFPTWSEVLEVLLAMGYRKVEAPSLLPGTNVQIQLEASSGEAPPS